MCRPWHGKRHVNICQLIQKHCWRVFLAGPSTLFGRIHRSNVTISRDLLDGQWGTFQTFLLVAVNDFCWPLTFPEAEPIANSWAFVVLPIITESDRNRYITLKIIWPITLVHRVFLIYSVFNFFLLLSQCKEEWDLIIYLTCQVFTAAFFRGVVTCVLNYVPQLIIRTSHECDTSEEGGSERLNMSGKW